MHKPTPTEIMLQRQVIEMQRQNELMKQLGTTVGFFQAYFNQLPKTKTVIEAFNHVNDQYFELWGEYRYTDWHSFRRSLNYHNKNNKLK